MSGYGPTRDDDRIDTLDILRGLGVLGILAVNATSFAYPPEAYINPVNTPFPLEGWSAEVWRVVHVFFEQKFITLFSMLFGVSLFLVGGERGNPERSTLLRWRLFWLAMIGIVHGAFVWYGDILLAYAVAGFVVSFCRSWSARALFGAGVLLYLAGAVFEISLAAMNFLPPAELEQARNDMGWNLSPVEMQAAIAAFGGSFDDSLSANFTNWVDMLWLLFYPKTYGLMMIGLALFKVGYLRGDAPAWVHAILVLLGSGILALTNQQAVASLAGNFQLADFMGLGRTASAFGTLIVTLGYASALMLLHRAVGSQMLWPLAATGRMAFTNYLTQSLIMTAIFFGGRGLGLFGQLDRPEIAVIVILIWVLQLAWSPRWLSAFSMGPMEWLWRCLTYGRLLPNRRPTA
jgi:uncharacterized protein